MSQPFKAPEDGVVDEIELELALLGLLDGPRAQAAERAATGPLSAQAAELAEAQRAWKQSRPPLPAHTPSPWRLGALLLAAVVLLAALVAAPWRAPQVPTPSARRMGAGLQIDVAAVRGGAPLAIRSAHFAPGDTLVLRGTASIDGVYHVLTIEDDGDTSVLWHASLHAGEPFSLDAAIQLDDHERQEWLLVMRTDDTLTDAVLVEQAASLLPSPARSADVWVLDISRAER